MMTKQQSIVLVAACLTGLLAGCNNPTFDAELGSAVEQNKAAHIVNAQPAPVITPDLVGTRSAKGINAYKQGREKRPGAETISVQ